MNKIRQIAVSVCLYFGTVLWTFVAMLFAGPVYCGLRFLGGLGRQEAVRMLIWLYGRGWVGLASLLMPIRRHCESINAPCVIVANHASIFDVYFMGAQPQWNVCMALKGWPFKIPGYAWFMRAAGYINLDALTLEESLETARSALVSGAALLFFPEGTRSRDGKIARFRGGAFLVAMQAGVPVTPLCLSGTHRLLPPGKWLVQPVRITVKALDPVRSEVYRHNTNGHVALGKIVRHKISLFLAEASGGSDSSS